MFAKLTATLLVAQVLAISSVLASDASKEIVKQAKQECSSFENGVLDIGDKAVSYVDLTGDGKPDEIVDAGQFSCSSAASLFCGTGGCSLTIVTPEKSVEFLAKGWKVVNWDQKPILLLAVHGSECGGISQRRCIRAMVWSEGEFRGVGMP